MFDDVIKKKYTNWPEGGAVIKETIFGFFD